MIFNSLRIIFFRLSPARRRTLVPLLALMLVGAVAEVVTIGALLPFLAAIANPDGSPFLSAVAPLLRMFGAGDPHQQIYALVALFALAALISAALRLTLLWASGSFVNGVAQELSSQLYADTLREPYSFHIARNSSESIALINNIEILTWQVLNPVITATIASIIACFITVGLIFVDAIVAVTSGIGFCAIYLLASRFTGAELRRNSAVIARAQAARVKAMQEGLGGIRDILLDRSQSVFTSAYDKAEIGFRQARVKNSFLGGAPRFIIESLGMIMIAFVAVIVVRRPGGLLDAVPVLGALALGAQRLLPLIQSVYAGWASVIGNRQVLFDVVALLSRPKAAPAGLRSTLPFVDKLELRDVSYSYPQSGTSALQGVSFEILKGTRIGVAGKTGSGKSTLMDIVLGLLEPTSGEIRVDGVLLTPDNRAAWERYVAHVPQSIYLADTSIAENVAFGVPQGEIDLARVWEAVRHAELSDVVAALPTGLNTRVGERGVQFSGGQRQRIGIARALYKQAKFLVFDEATSALDTETEAAVMAAIQRLDRSLTIVIIAHRLSTLDECDAVVWLDAGQIKAIERRSPGAFGREP